MEEEDCDVTTGIGTPGTYEEYKTKYEEIKEIGKGGYSSVKLIKNLQTDEACVSKVTYLSQRKNESVRKNHKKQTLVEIKIYHAIQGPDLKSGHDHVLKMLGWYVQTSPDGQNIDTIVEIFEQCHCDLFHRFAHDFKGPLTEAQARPVIEEIAQGLRFLHEKNIAHRDLKMSNVLCAHPTNLTPVKLCDFNVSRYKSEADRPSPMSKGTGSFNIIDPLRIQKYLTLTQGKSVPVQYSRKCDSWSLGTILYTLLTAEELFQAECHCGDMDCSAMEVDENGRKRYNPFAYTQCQKCFENNLKMRCSLKSVDDLSKIRDCSTPYRDLLQGLLELEEDDRFSMNEVLSHNWIDCRNPLIQRKRNQSMISKIFPKESLFNMAAKAYAWLLNTDNEDSE